jgi:hypothetical protein
MDADRFKFEQELVQLSSTEDDLDILIENVIEETRDADEISNALIGIQTLFKMRYQRMFNTFEALVHNGAIGDPRKKAKDTSYA